MDLELKGRVIAVTGGSRGIGRVIAERLALEGATLAIAARDAQSLAEAHAELEARGVPCLAYACDLAQPGEAAAFVAAAGEAFGRVDGLVCNAGAGGAGTLAEGSHEGWAGTFALNLLHAAEALQAAVPLMPEGGSAVFIASISGRKPVARGWAYGAAKAGLIHAAGSLALELAPQSIRVNAVSAGSTLVEGGGWAERAERDPGRFERFLAEEMPRGRLSTPEEIADVVAFLLSGRSAGINGADVAVDGGQGRPSW